MSGFLRLASFRLGSERLVVFVDIIKFLVILVLLNHIFACVWYGLGNWESRHGTKTWLYDAKLEKEKTETQYMECFMWALLQFAGGSDKYYPRNLDERIYNSGTLLVGLIAAACLNSGFTSAMTRLLLISSGPAKQLAVLRAYLSQNRVSQRLVVRVQRNARHIVTRRQRYVLEVDVELLQLISAPLRAELHYEIRSPIISVHPFFFRYQDCCPSGMRHICENAIAAMPLSPGDVFFSCGESPSDPAMYFLTDGTLKYEQLSKPPCLVTHGMWFSEPVLWTLWIHCGTLTTKSHSQVMALNAKSFSTIANSFETMHFSPSVFATEYVEKLNLVDANDLTDLDMDFQLERWCETGSNASLTAPERVTSAQTLSQRLAEFTARMDPRSPRRSVGRARMW